MVGKRVDARTEAKKWEKIAPYPAGRCMVGKSGWGASRGKAVLS